MKRYILPVLTLTASLCAPAQAIWDIGHLTKVKSDITRPMYAAAMRSLESDADSLLSVRPLSVMMKQKVSPSGDNHNYTSLARYFHPDPAKPDGLPYVNRDGVTNPEIYQWDRGRFGDTTSRVSTLALAWFFTGKESYADKATELVRVWFLDPETRMNPNLEYAQMVPGENGGKGRCYGVLDGYSLVEMLDAVSLLKGSQAWTDDVDRGLTEWMNCMLDWILTSPQGIEESRQLNNHSTVYDALTLSLAIYTGREQLAREIIRSFPDKRIFTQIEPDGSQPHEMWRTLSYGYSQYNLSHMTDIFMMASKLGMKIDNATDSEGRNFYKALDRLASYLGHPREDWPGQQISGWEEKQQAVAQDLWRVAAAIDTTRNDYRLLYRKYRQFNPSDRFTLLYYTPDETDDAFTNASATLRRAIRNTVEARKDSANIVAGNVNPRSITGDGTITLVHPHDWTSGFFPGELWMMYEYTNDPYWLEMARSYTLDIEMAQNHAGTHDLGFMIGNSFGKGWKLTGDSAYLSVEDQAAHTLCTRYSPAVGAIRSWDHNADTWKYPVIIDNMMNLEMLFDIAAATGNDTLRSIAVSHADVTLRNHFRPDGSSYHVVDYDPASGTPRLKVTAQGYADDSFWSRGQAWTIYGYTMCYRYTADKRYLDHAKSVADWFLALHNMPADMIPYWDMKAPGTERNDNPDVPRDASAAAIIASGLYELAGYLPPDEARPYCAKADTILHNLTTGYTLPPETCAGFILGHSTGHLPAGSEIDVPLVYADYYYLEALMRKQR